MKESKILFFLFLIFAFTLSTARAEAKSVELVLPKNSPRVHILGAEFVLVEKSKLPKKIDIMRNRWKEINQVYDKNIFEGNNIPLPRVHQNQWKALVSVTEKKPNPLKTLRNVNGFFNSISSRKDKDFYGKNEHWATPQEFISNRSGDCEDYAITKYFALQHFKWPAEDLWLVFLHDNINIGGHAVLVAKTGNKSFVLDNLSKPVYLLVSAEQYKNQVTPFAMANHQGFWLRVNEKKTSRRENKPKSDSGVGIESR